MGIMVALIVSVQRLGRLSETCPDNDCGFNDGDSIRVDYTSGGINKRIVVRLKIPQSWKNLPKEGTVKGFADSPEGEKVLLEDEWGITHCIDANTYRSFYNTSLESDPED